MTTTRSDDFSATPTAAGLPSAIRATALVRVLPRILVREAPDPLEDRAQGLRPQLLEQLLELFG